MQFACVVYAGIFKHMKNIPKYKKLMVTLCVCTRHILAYTSEYHHILSYDVIWRHMSEYGGISGCQDSRWRLGASSGNPRKLRMGICLSYTCHMTYRLIYLSYTWYMTSIFFRTKLVFISCWMDTRHPSVLQIYRMSLSMQGVYILKSYKVSKKAMVYDNQIPFIWMVFTRIIMFFDELHFTAKETTKLPPQV